MNRLLTIVDSKYQRLEYLESTGTQYIDTGIKPTNATTIKTKLISTTKDIFPYGSRTSGNSSDKHTWNMSDENRFFPQFASDSSAINYVWSTQTIYEIENGQNGAYVNGVKIKTYSEATFNSTLNMFLFGLNENGSLENRTLIGRIYYFQVYEETTLVRNFVPVLRKTDNELGMLDLVEGKFYSNAGTGKFTANLDTMYAIIQGSPTQSPYGVFSGFSASNYLAIPNFPTYTQADKIEVVFNFTCSTLYQSVLCGGEATFLVPYITSAGKIAYYGSAIGLTGATGTNTLVANQNYWFKAVYDTTSFNAYISTDGKTWTLDYSKSVSVTFSRSGIFELGNNSSSSVQYLRGSMNLNNSYIKLGSTKYNLQAVVGYTIAGTSVVNNNGVLSDFSNGFASTPNLVANNINSIEYQIKIKTSTISTQQIGGINNYMVVQTWGTKFRLYNSNVDLKSTENAQDNTTYYVRAKCSIADNKMYLMFSTDKINWITYATDIDGNDYKNINNNIQYGRNSYGSFLGEIDMNETYIKINNKLWFNGQQA